MNIMTADSKYSIPLDLATWQTLCSTVRYRLAPYKKEIHLALRFLEKKFCGSADCLETARQFNLIRDKLSSFNPDQIIYNETDLSQLPPWGRNISSTITSCANYLTSSDGFDLLSEIVRVLSCADAYALNVIVQ